MKLTPAQRYEVGKKEAEMGVTSPFVNTKSNTQLTAPVNTADVYLTKDWAKYVMKRMGMVKRRASTKVKTTVINFDELKEIFLQDIKHSMLMDEILIKGALIMFLYPPGAWKSREQKGLKLLEKKTSARSLEFLVSL